MIVAPNCLLSREEMLSLFGFVVSITQWGKKSKQLEASSLSNLNVTYKIIM